MPSQTVKLENFPDELKDFIDETIERKKKAIINGLYASIPALVAASPVDQGLYAASWDITITEESAILGNYAPHAPIIEHGARPFTPPIGPLLAWAKRVLRDPSQPPEYSHEVWALARGTQRKIQDVGMAPRHVLQKMIPDIIRNIRREFEQGG